MISIDYIQDNSKPLGVLGGKRITFYNDKYILSIVGGAMGLYGDFEENFEVAIIDPQTGNFITKLFYPDNSDDVIPYLSEEKVEKILNTLFKEGGFQVR